MSDIIKRLLMKPVPDADGLLSQVLREDAAAEIERLRTIIKQYEAAHFKTKDAIIEQCAVEAERHLDGVEAVGWLSSVAKSTAAAVRALKNK